MKRGPASQTGPHSVRLWGKQHNDHSAAHRNGSLEMSSEYQLAKPSAEGFGKGAAAFN